jgi:hypothetical protein
LKRLPFLVSFLAVFLLAAGAQQQPRAVLALDRLEIRGDSGPALPDAASLTDALLGLWNRQYGAIVTLAARSFAPAGSPSVRPLIESSPAAILVHIRFASPPALEQTVALRISADGVESLPSALAGGIFRLWAGRTGYIGGPTSRPPLPAGLLNLRALELLLAEGEEIPEAVDVTAAAGGPLLVFSRRLLQLGARMEITEQTLRSLYFPPPLDPGTLIGTAFLSKRGEPRLYAPSSGGLLFADTGGQVLFDSALIDPEDTVALGDGGFAMLKGGTLYIFRRGAQGLAERRIALPPGLYSALCADTGGNLWVFDPAERRFRVFSQQGKEIRSVTPLLEAGELPFPHLCAVMPSGAFLLGGPGTLVCFEADGLPRWRLRSVRAFFREALPAAFRLALMPEEDGFYLLDLSGNRLLLFRDPAALETDTPEAVWAARFAAFDPHDPGQLRTALTFLQENRLLLQAYHPALLLGDALETAKLKRRLDIRAAELSTLLSEQMETRFLLPEAEAALGAALRLYHRLRRDDPVDARWPAAIETLTARRSALRAVLFAEPLLDVKLYSSKLESGPEVGAPRRLRAEIAVRNNGARPLRQLRLEAALGGLTAEAPPLLIAVLEGGTTVVRSLSLQLEEDPDAEAQLARLAVRASYSREGGGRQSQYFPLPLPLPGN